MRFQVTGMNKSNDINGNDEDVSLIVEATSAREATLRVARDSERRGFRLYGAKATEIA